MRFLTLLVAVACLSFARGAPAQGVAPGELGLPAMLELAELADLLEAHAPVQPGGWPVVEQAHAEYAAKYAQLLDRELGPLLQPGARRGSAWVAELQRRREPALRKVLALEAAMLDSFRPVVDESKGGGLERVRRRRAAGWYEGSLRSQGIGAAIFADISRMVYAVEEARPHREALTLTLEAYESTRSRELAQFMDGLLDAFARFSLLYADMEEVDPEDREAQQAVFERARVASAEIAAGMAPKFRQLLEHQRRTMQAVEQQLPQDVRRKFVDQFVRGAYTGTSDAEGMGVPALVRRALRLRSLTQEEREQVLRIEESWWQADRALLGEHMDLEDGQTAAWIGQDGDSWTAYNARVTEVQGRRTRRAEQARAELIALLGDDRGAHLSGPEDASALRPEGTAADPGAEALARAEADAQVEESLRTLATIPRPTAAWLEYLRVRASADPVGDAVFQVLWGDAEEKWQEEVVAAQEAALPLVRAAAPLSTNQAPNWEQARQGEALVRDAVPKARAIVAGFLANLRESVPTVSADATACAQLWWDLEAIAWRLREREPVHAGMWWVNLPRAVEASVTSRPADDRSRLVAMESVGLQAQIPALQDAAEHAFAARRKLIASFADESLGNWDSPEREAIQEADTEAGAAAEARAAAIAQETIASLGRIAAQVEPEERALLERLARFDRDAALTRRMPSLPELLQAARAAVDDAGDPQAAAEIEAVRAEAIAAYDELVDALVDVRLKNPQPEWNASMTEEEGMAVHEQWERRIVLARAAGDKVRQHVQKVVLRLERILGEERAKKVPAFKKMRDAYFGEEMWWLFY